MKAKRFLTLATVGTAVGSGVYFYNKQQTFADSSNSNQVDGAFQSVS